jgi:hypothetical protein
VSNAGWLRTAFLVSPIIELALIAIFQSLGIRNQRHLMRNDDEINRSLQARFADDLLGKATASKLDIANDPMQNWGGSNARGSVHRRVHA